MIYDFSFQIETTGNSDNNNVIFIVVAVLVTIVLLAVIIAATYLIRARSKRKESNTPRDTENGAANVNENEVVRMQQIQNAIAMNPINQPRIAVYAPTPGNHMPEIYPPGQMFARPLFGSANSDHSHSSVPSRKSSAGYESGTDCSCTYTRCSPYASNYSPPRCCHCDRYYTTVPQHQQHQQQQLERPDDEPDNRELPNSQQQPAANTNLNNPKSMRRNLSDPNISRHKQPSSRTLEDQRTKKLLSSSSVV